MVATQSVGALEQEFIQVCERLDGFIRRDPTAERRGRENYLLSLLGQKDGRALEHILRIIRDEKARSRIRALQKRMLQEGAKPAGHEHRFLCEAVNERFPGLFAQSELGLASVYYATRIFSVGARRVGRFDLLWISDELAKKLMEQE